MQAKTQCTLSAGEGEINAQRVHADDIGGGEYCARPAKGVHHAVQLHHLSEKSRANDRGIHSNGLRPDHEPSWNYIRQGEVGGVV